MVLQHNDGLQLSPDGGDAQSPGSKGCSDAAVLPVLSSRVFVVGVTRASTQRIHTRVGVTNSVWKHAVGVACCVA